MEKEKNENKKPVSFRDSLIIVVVLLAAALGYFMLTETETVAQHDHQAEMTQDHGMTQNVEQMIAQLPEDYNALIQQGNQYMDNRVYPVAIEAYSRALDINPDNVNVMVDLGACYHAIGNLDTAMDMFRSAVEKEPDHAIAHFNLGIAYLGYDSTKKAADAWRKYLELEPNSAMRDTVESFIRMLEERSS